MWRVALSLSLFWGSLTVGFVGRRQGWMAAQHARRLIALMIKALEPIIIGLSFWQLNLSHPRILLLPAVGCIISLATVLPAWLLGRRLRLRPSEMGVYLPCAFFSNVGYLGAFIAFALYGEQGFGLGQLYLLFFAPCFYTLGFGLARYYGGRQRDASTHDPQINPDRWQCYPLGGLAVGLALNLLRVPRPAWCGSVNHVLIPTATALYLMAVGSQLRVTSRLRQQWQACLGMSAIKFAYAPLVGWLVGSLVGLGQPAGGAALRVTVLQASMPVATLPLVLPLLFKVDGELANHLWIVTTVLTIPLLPCLIWALGRL